MNERPSVSVVVPVLNGAETIGDMLRALVTQLGLPDPPEIVIVDNGSTDATREIVGQFAVTLIEEPKRNPGAARNRGLHHARGDVIAHLDADTLPTRRWLAEIVAPFANSEVHLVAGRTLSFRPETAAERYSARANMYDAEHTINRPILPFAASLNLAVRRRSALAIDGWADDMRTAEDLDFCHRLRHAFPVPGIYQAKAVLFHRNRQSDAALWRQAWSYGEGAAELYARYPESLRWGAAQRIGVTRGLAAKLALAAWSQVAWQLGTGSAADAEFATYGWRWGWNFWRGFFHYRRHRVYQRDPRHTP